MVASVLIVVFSLALLVYWFRYSCILLLRNQAELMASSKVADDGRFHIAEVRELLLTEQQLDTLHTSLNRDYQLLTYLLEHATGLELATIENRILVLDYKVMRWWYRLTRTAAPQQARQALYEMASILNVLAQKMGEQAGVRTES